MSTSNEHGGEVGRTTRDMGWRQETAGERAIRETAAVIKGGPSKANLDLLRAYYEGIGMPTHHSDALIDQRHMVVGGPDFDPAVFSEPLKWADIHEVGPSGAVVALRAAIARVTEMIRDIECDTCRDPEGCAGCLAVDVLDAIFGGDLALGDETLTATTMVPTVTLTDDERHAVGCDCWGINGPRPHVPGCLAPVVERIIAARGSHATTQEAPGDELGGLERDTGFPQTAPPEASPASAEVARSGTAYDEGTAFCAGCPDHEACATGTPCDTPPASTPGASA